MRSLDQTTLNNLLEYIVDYQKIYGKSPTYRQIMKKMHFSGMAAVARYVNRLHLEGRIKKDNLGGIEIAPQFNPSKTQIFQLVGEVACGNAILAVENIKGAYPLPCDIFGTTKGYLLEAQGTSMINAGIQPNDLLVIDNRNFAENGEIVVARINKEEATVKRFFKNGNKVILRPENPEFQEKEYNLEDVEIAGVVKCNIHKF